MSTGWGRSPLHVSFSRKNRCPRLTGDDPSVPQLRQSCHQLRGPGGLPVVTAVSEQALWGNLSLTESMRFFSKWRGVIQAD